MNTLLAQADAVLRGGTGPGPPGQTFVPTWSTLMLTCLCGLVYGAVMGSFGGVTGERSWQVAFAALKVPALILVSFALSLPSFFVVNTLLGMRNDFGEVVRVLSTSQAALTVILVGLAPYTLFWYVSCDDYGKAIVFNGLMFAVATALAQARLRRAYRPLIARRPSHRYLLRIWLFLYTFVAIQMAWVLRPFVGSPYHSVQFLRDDAWGNAYVTIAELVWRVLTQ